MPQVSRIFGGRTSRFDPPRRAYDMLAGAHDAIAAWHAANGRAVGPASWEIYSDPSEDPAKVEVQVIYLLA